MWLSIPSNFVPVSACSEKASAPHSLILASSTEPFATWSGKPLPPARLSRLWKREPLIRRLSGLTCSPSTVQLGATAWISSLRASRVRTSPLLAAGPAWTGSARGCSSGFSTSPTLAVRGASFWRTSQASLLPPPPLWTKPKGLLKNAPPPASWENWPTAGGMRNGSLCQRPMWVPAMGVPGGSVSPGAWPTPDTGHERINRSSSKGAAYRPTIALAAKQWATPTSHDGRRPGADLKSTQGGNLSRGSALWMTPSVSNSQGNEYTRDRGTPGLKRLTLTGQAQHWPTPDVCSGSRDLARLDPQRQKRADQKATIGIAAAAENWPGAWPTPASRDFRTPNSQESQARRGHSGGEQLPNFVEHHFLHPVHSTLDGRTLSPTDRTLPRRLNPAFACWLMGWPTWWTNPALTNSVRSEMASYRCRLQQHLCSFFGELDLPDGHCTGHPAGKALSFWRQQNTGATNSHAQKINDEDGEDHGKRVSDAR